METGVKPPPFACWEHGARPELCGGRAEDRGEAVPVLSFALAKLSWFWQVFEF